MEKRLYQKMSKLQEQNLKFHNSDSFGLNHCTIFPLSPFSTPGEGQPLTSASGSLCPVLAIQIDQRWLELPLTSLVPEELGLSEFGPQFPSYLDLMFLIENGSIVQYLENLFPLP